MKTTIIACGLAAGFLLASPLTFAQSRDQASQDEAQTRKQLAEARERLDKAAREVAELSGKLGENVRREVRIIDGPRRAVLGIQLDPQSGKDGARVLSVSPGGPAAEAGLRDRDIIIALDGQTIAGSEPNRTLVTRMQDVKPDQKIKVRVLRDGKKHDYVVVARPLHLQDRVVDLRMPEMGVTMSGSVHGPGGIATGPLVQHFRFLPGEFEGLELASISPRLGAYFGVSEGVLVVQAPKDGAFKLEDGDVIQSIDGRKPDSGPHALRILRSYRGGEQLTLTVLRQRKSLTLPVTMPERPDFGDVFFNGEGPMTAPLPALPGAPAAPPVPVKPGVPPAGATATME